MRSRESANRPMIAISLRIRWRSGRRKRVAAATTQKAATPMPHRPLRPSVALTVSVMFDCIGWFPLWSAATGEKSLRAQGQDENQEGVDDEGAKARHVVLARHVGDAEQQGGQERAGDARRPAHGDDD